MKETLKRIKADVILSAILCVALGVILMIWPTQVTKVLCYILAAILCVMGIGHVISYMRNKLESRLGLATGIALVILGVWILVQPLNFAKIFPVVIGVVLLMHGLEDLRMTIEAKQNGDTAWGILLLITILNFAFGILLIWKAIEMVQIAMVIVGIALIYDGLSDLFVVYRVAGAVKAAKQAGKESGQKNNGEDCETGAVVMLSVKDFSVLAAASYPTYDLNRYSEYGSYYVKLSENKNSPMYNRATVGTFACGSVFKPCVAGAALEEKIITDKTKIYCKQDYDFYPTNVVRCMHYHGSLDVTGAIEQSCNYFFADTGRRLGIEPMYLYAQKFGLGEYTGVEIEESKGTLAGRDSTSWQAGNTVSAAIGQSDNAFTPVQLATYVATIANNGERLKTHIVDKVTNYERTKTVKSTDVESYGDCGISKKNLDIVRKAMLGVTQNENGTANYMFGDYKVKVAAKTGTAENSGSDHTTFICYAPYEKPEVAIAVVIEHGAKGRYSMQVAKNLLDAYFN